MCIHFAAIDRKFIVLSHDYFYNDSEGGPAKGPEDLFELRNFIEKALELGYKFSTMDKYITDDPDNF